MQLKDFSTTKVFSVQADESIDKAIQLLEQHHVRHLPVVRDGSPVGMVSVGDVLMKVGGLLSDERVSTRDETVPLAGPALVEQIMTKGVIALSSEEPIATAARLMLEKGITAIILVSNEKVVGIVTESDYLRRFCDETSLVSDSCRQQQVVDYMATDLVTAAPDETTFALIRKMGKRYHHLPVVEDGNLIGILSDHDVRRALALDKVEKITDPSAHLRLIEDYDARRVMKSDVETTAPTATLAEAAGQMIEKKIGALPVIEAGSLVGIITETDLLKACVSGLAE